MFEYPGIEELFLVKKALRSENKYDLMISFAVPYPVHWGVAFSKTKSNPVATTWIADCGDPYMGDVLDSFRKPFYFKYLEKKFCRKADFITIPVETARDGYYTEFHEKIKVIPQGFLFNAVKTQGTIRNKVPRFAYAGGFLKGIRDPEAMLEYLCRVKTPFEFHVYTNKPELLIPYKELLGGKLIISEYIPREILMEILSKMDFLINFDNNTSRNIPSKLIDYSIIGRPVLNITNDFSGNDLFEFLNGNYEKKMLLPDPWDFHITNIAKHFLQLIESNNEK